MRYIQNEGTNKTTYIANTGYSNKVMNEMQLTALFEECVEIKGLDYTLKLLGDSIGRTLKTTKSK